MLRVNAFVDGLIGGAYSLSPAFYVVVGNAGTR